MLSRISRFIVSVLKHWGVLVTSGAIIGALSIWQGIGHTVKPWAYWTVAITGLFIAFFRAWNDQANAVEITKAANSALLAKIGELEWPPDRPKVGFSEWGTVRPEDLPEGHHPAMMWQHGFWLSNDGGPALEVRVEDFSVGIRQAKSRIIPRIEGHSRGFALIWLEGINPVLKFELGAILMQAVDAEINQGKMRYGQEYRILLRATYRDFNDVWYSSEAEMIFHHHLGRLEFSSVFQKRLGFKRARD